MVYVDKQHYSVILYFGLSNPYFIVNYRKIGVTIKYELFSGCVDASCLYKQCIKQNEAIWLSISTSI